MKLLSVHKSTDTIPFLIVWCKSYEIVVDEKLIIHQDTGSSFEVIDWDYLTVSSRSVQEQVECMKDCYLQLIQSK